MRAKLLQPLGEVDAHIGATGDEVFLLEDLEVLECSHRTNRMPAEGQQVPHRHCLLVLE